MICRIQDITFKLVGIHDYENIDEVTFKIIYRDSNRKS